MFHIDRNDEMGFGWEDQKHTAFQSLKRHKDQRLNFTARTLGSQKEEAYPSLQTPPVLYLSVFVLHHSDVPGLRKPYEVWSWNIRILGDNSDPDWGVLRKRLLLAVWGLRKARKAVNSTFVDVYHLPAQFWICHDSSIQLRAVCDDDGEFKELGVLDGVQVGGMNSGDDVRGR